MNYNGPNSYLFVNGAEIYKFKASDSEIVATLLYLGDISKDWSVDNMKKTGFYGNVYDFSVGYDAIAADNILNTHNYLMKKNDMCSKMFEVIKKCFFTGLAFFLGFMNVNLLNCISEKKCYNINNFFSLYNKNE